MEADTKQTPDRHEDSTEMETLVLGEDSRHRPAIGDLAVELVAASAGLRRSLPPGVVRALADLVRAMNCYYSNLIEGHDSHPVDIERAMKNDYSADVRKRNLQLEAKAHVTVQSWVDGGGLTDRAVTKDGIREIHRRFCELLPEELLKVTDPDTGEEVPVIPGEFRLRDVRVGNHIPISPGAVPRFLDRFESVYAGLGRSEAILASAAAHHRLHSGTRTSKERTLRLMREHGLQSPCRPLVAPEEKLHDGVITTETPNEMWGTDMTTTSTILDGQAAIFIAIDHCTGQIVGIHASKRQDRFEALEPIRQGVAMHFGEFEAEAACGLKLRHDHGSNYMADDFQNEIKFLGIESSPAFVREPEGNGCAERFMRTLKENLLWVRHFETIDELRQALLAFQKLYNSEWLLERHAYRTPNQVFDDLTNKTLATAA